MFLPSSFVFVRAAGGCGAEDTAELSFEGRDEVFAAGGAVWVWLRSVVRMLSSPGSRSHAAQSSMASRM